MKFKMDIYTMGALVLNLVFIIIGIIIDASFLFILDMILFVSMMFYCLKRIEERSLLFAFGTSFFVFLLGREFLQVFFHYKVEEHYVTTTNNHAYLCILLALLGIWLSYAYTEEKARRKRVENINSYFSEIRNDAFTNNVKILSRFLFYASMPFALGMRMVIAWFVRGAGYLEYYTDFVETIYGSNIFLYILGRLENVMPVALGIFLSTLPGKKEARPLLFFYVIYLIVSLGCGNRGIFMLGILYIFVFVTYMQGKRPEEKWFQRKQMFYLLLLVPVIAVLGAIYGAMRFDSDTGSLSLFEAFLSFFYDQGGTITLIKHAYELEDMIPRQGPYLFEFLHSGVLARLFGIPVYHGNTVEHAMHGGSFQHAIAYVLMGTAYLNGRGTGSCYIAELYYDVRYIGVFVGSALYGWLFCQITRGKINRQFLRSLVFVLITQFLWAPRGTYAGFISFSFAPTTIASFLFVWGIAKIVTLKG